MVQHRSRLRTAHGRTVGVLALSLLAAVSGPMPSAVSVTPGAPTGLTVTQPNATTSLLGWTAVSGATKYEVQVDNEEAFSSPEYSATTTNTTVVPNTNLRSGLNHWRVRAVNASNEASSWTIGEVTPAPVGVPQPVSPVTGSTLVQPDDAPLLTWTEVQGATSYTVEVDGDNDFIDAKSYSTATTSLVVPDPLGAGDWFWRVKASRGTGLVSLPSPASSFLIEAIPAPTLVSPNNSANEPVEDVVLDWLPVDGAKSYEVQVANNVDFTNVIETRTGILGTQYSPAAGYNNDQYYWRVRAVDLAGTPTPWTQSQFNFKRQWPDRPWPTFPVQDGLPTEPDSANHDPLDLPLKTITTPAPYFQWTPVQHASHYQLDVSRDANFSTFSSCRIAGTTYTPGNGVFSTTNFTRSPEEDCLIDEGVVTYWRVRPMDRPYSATGFSDGIQGIYSPTQRFVWDPVYFNGLSPTAGEPVAVPALRWTPQMPAEKYKIELFKAGAATPFHTATTRATSYTPVNTKLNPADGPFTWRLSAIEAGGRTSALVSNTFELLGTPPTTGVPALTALSGRSTDPATTRAPQLSWEPMSGAEYYRVRMGDSGTGFFWTPASDEALGKNLFYPAFTETGLRLLQPGQYDWVVQAFDSTGTPIGESAPNTFRIAAFPAVSGQQIALDGKTLDSGGGCTERLDNAGAICADVPATPVLSWDHQPGMSFYVVYVSQDANFTNLTETTRIPNTVNTRYAFTFSNNRPALEDNQSGVPYYWHIRPCKAIGVCGPDPVSAATGMAENAFLKVSPRVGLLQPADGVPVDTHEITFDWADYFETNQNTTWRTEKSPQAAKWYRLQVDDSDNFAAPFIDDILIDQSTYTAFTKLYPDRTLYWRVAAIDGADNELNWSQTWSFRKQSPAVGLVSPAVDATVAGTAPFRWNAQAFASSYRIQVYKNNDTTFSPDNRVLDKVVKTAAYAHNVPLPVSSEPYLWRVLRTDASNNDGPWSEPARFSVASGQLTLTSPVAGSVQLPNGPVFGWEPLAGATKYRIEVISGATGAMVANVSTPATAYATSTNLATGPYTWKVTALDANNTAMASSQRTFTVDAGMLATTPPLITAPTGTAIGQTLTSTPPTWNRSGVTDGYQWLRDGQAISGATSATYVLVLADYGRSISLRVTGKLAGYTNGTATSNALVGSAAGALQSTSPPTITGTVIVGNALKATSGGWAVAGTSFKYQWLRNGAPVPGATSASYTLKPEDAGTSVSVTVLASKTGYADGAASAVAVSVPKMKSTTSATLSATRVKPGKRVKIGITVAIQGVPGPTGGIRVYDGAKLLKTLTLVSTRDGKIGWRLPKLKVGKHKIKAVYVGNDRTLGSKSKILKLYVVR